MMFQNILVVCVGNICRSPTAEYLLKKYFPRGNISSAGLNALAGQGADVQAAAEAQRNGLDLSAHTARQLTWQICRDADLILVMEQKHIDAVAKIDLAARGKTLVFGQWLPESPRDIADPYRKSDDIFRYTYTRLDTAARAWAEKLNQSR